MGPMLFGALHFLVSNFTSPLPYWSVANIFTIVLLFVLWYCHKRGREVRLERERIANGNGEGSSGRVEELSDDSPSGLTPSPMEIQMLEPATESAASSSSRAAVSSSRK